MKILMLIALLAFTPAISAQDAVVENVKLQIIYAVHGYLDEEVLFCIQTPEDAELPSNILDIRCMPVGYSTFQALAVHCMAVNNGPNTPVKMQCEGYKEVEKPGESQGVPKRKLQREFGDN